MDMPYFKSLSEEVLDNILASMSSLKLPKGRTLIHQGSVKNNNDVYFVMKGEFAAF